MGSRDVLHGSWDYAALDGTLPPSWISHLFTGHVLCVNSRNDLFYAHDGIVIQHSEYDIIP